MSTDAQPCPAVTGPVLLVVGAGAVSRAAVIRAARLAASASVTVIGVGAGTEQEKVRQAVAQAMTALENTGVMAHGHIAVTGSPARAVTRMARARGARVVVLGERCPLAAELRRRMYGSGVIVLSAAGPAADHAGRPPSAGLA
jgi:hypothetical protein